MIDFLARLAINAVALVVAVTVVPHIRFAYGDEWWKLVAVALIFGLINTYIRPIVAALSLPLTVIALGLVGLIVNAAMLLLTAFVSAQFKLGFAIAGWPDGPFKLDTVIWALVAAVVIAAVSTALGLVRKIVPSV
jgi:putative membrane protein